MFRRVLLVTLVAACAGSSPSASIHLGPATFATGDATVQSLSIGLAAMGRADEMRAVDRAATPTLVDGEVRTRRLDGVSEWWRETDGGLEHGVTIERRPDGAGALSFELAVGGATAIARSDDDIELRDRSGATIASYAHLDVRDRNGARVPARLRADDDGIVIDVDDADAEYPLVIDPVLIAQLRGVHGTAEFDNGGQPEADMFGYALGISGDATRVVVGSYGERTIDPAVRDVNGSNNTLGRGAVRVFTRSGNDLTQEATIIASDTYVGYGNFYTGEHFGKAVAIDGDGTRIIVGDPDDTEANRAGSGSAWIYVRNGTTWTQEANVFSSTGIAFGGAVAISEDGTRAFVGAPQEPSADDATHGAVYVYARTGSTWTLEARLSPTAATSSFGAALAVTADGATLYVDGLYELGGTGAVHVYQRDGSDWTEGTLLTAPAPSAQTDRFGCAIAVTPDGSRLLVGAYGRDAGPPGAGLYPGEAFMFTGGPGAWTLEHSFRADESGNQFFGGSVALDAAGDHALIGYGFGQGSGWLMRSYFRDGTTWSDGVPIRTVEPADGGHKVSPVALSDDGTLGMLGAAETDAGPDLCGPPGQMFYYCRLPSFANVYTFAPAPAGSTCSLGVECATGTCVDGVCCTSACDGGSEDCQACSIAAGGTEDGTCTPLAAAIAPTRTCRASAGVCDIAETCSASSTTCPPDTFADSSRLCRAGHGTCDPEERCDGTSADCPADQLAPPGTECRPSTGACDPAEVCLADQVSCPPDVDHCSSEPDGGVGADAAVGGDGGRGADGGGGVDAGSGGPGEQSGGDAGCAGCASSQGSPIGALLVAIVLFRRRHRR